MTWIYTIQTLLKQEDVTPLQDSFAKMTYNALFTFEKFAKIIYDISSMEPTNSELTPGINDPQQAPSSTSTPGPQPSLQGSGLRKR